MNEHLARLARAHVGPVSAWHPQSERGAQAQLWRAVGPQGSVVLKRHHQPAGWVRERDAYVRLRSLQGELIPRLLEAVRAPEPVLVLEALPGTSVATSNLSASELLEAHARAGELRARLDGVTTDPDPIPLEEAYASRFQSWHAHARGRVPERVRQRAARVFDAAAFRGCHRVFCHRDFTPSNWMVERTGEGLRLRLVDLGQARPDVALVDLVKLREDFWHGQPSLEQAFLAGWGRELGPDDLHRLDLLGILHGLATASWAHAHGDELLHRHGLAIAERRLGYSSAPPAIQSSMRSRSDCDSGLTD
jgi:serine/threonine protein kinase